MVMYIQPRWGENCFFCLIQLIGLTSSKFDV